MAGRKQRYTVEQVVDAIRDARGLTSFVARRLGCDVKTVRNYRDRYKAVRDELDMQRGLMLDTAELKLYDAVERGEMWAIKYILSTLGKDRGYTTRQEIAAPDSEPIKVKMTWGDVDYRKNLHLLAPDGANGKA